MNYAQLPHWLLVGIGGFVGSVGRYAGAGLVHRLLPRALFPFGTLAVNAFGCLFIGLLGGMSESRGLLTPESRLLLMIGLLGGMTTFSTFGFETFRMLRDGQIAPATLNVLAHLVVGLAAVWLGDAVGRSL